MCLIKPATLKYHVDFGTGLMPAFEKLVSMANDESLTPQRAFKIVEYSRFLSESMCTDRKEGDYYAFHTGLFTPDDRIIYCLCKHNTAGLRPQKYTFVGWQVSGEGQIKIDRLFSSLPQKPSLFSDFSELHYDTRLGAPTISIEHALERLDRFPKQFLERICGGTVESYQKHLEENALSAQLFRSSLLTAVDTAYRRAQYDPFLCVPVYYVRRKKISLLLPLCLTASDKADLALVVMKSDTDNYVGATILTLEQAWVEARILGSVNSNWLRID